MAADDRLQTAYRIHTLLHRKRGVVSGRQKHKKRQSDVSQTGELRKRRKEGRKACNVSRHWDSGTTGVMCPAKL